MSDRTTFHLPGHAFNPFAERKCLLSLLAAYSKQWNPRNLEAPWYEPWSQIFADLVAEHPSLSVAPQPYLWYDPILQVAHTAPGPDHLLSTEDEQLNEEQDDVGDATLNSIRSVSIPAHRNRSRIPDFAITRKVSFQRPNNSSEIFHLDRRVTYLGLPLLVELKASGARCQDIETSLSNATKPMNLAREQLLRQAYHLFHMYPHQQSVILVAVSGFWWSYSAHSRILSEKFAHQEDEDEEDDVCLDEEAFLSAQSGIHAILTENLPKSEPAEISMDVLKEKLYGFSVSDIRDIYEAVPSQTRFRTALSQSQVALCDDGWSEYLLYGTLPSNQALGLILDHLHSVVHVHYDGKMG